MSHRCVIRDPAARFFRRSEIRETNVNRRDKTMIVLVGGAVLATTLFLLWCPPAACRALNIRTTAVTSLDEYRQFLADQEAFYSSHHSRAVRIDCASLREEVITALNSGRLTVGAGEGLIEAWHQSRLLHLTDKSSRTDEERQAWAATVRRVVTARQDHDLAFLSHLFGGVVLHVTQKQLPLVLFSDDPCV